jgi:hypothetical protein
LVVHNRRRDRAILAVSVAINVSSPTKKKKKKRRRRRRRRIKEIQTSLCNVVVD